MYEKTPSMIIKTATGSIYEFASGGFVRRKDGKSILNGDNEWLPLLGCSCISIGLPFNMLIKFPESNNPTLRTTSPVVSITGSISTALKGIPVEYS